MDKKSNELLELLNHTKTWTTCADLAQKLNITPRKVRYMISKINAEKNIITSSSKGYFLKKDDVVAPSSTYNPSIIPANVHERRKYIFEQLIIFNKTLNIDEISGHLCISPITFKNELAALRKEISHYGLYFRTKNNNVSVIGNEGDRQKFAMALIRTEMEHSNFSLANIQKFFLTVELNKIKQVVIEVFTKHEYFIDEYSLLNYVLNLAVCIEHGSIHGLHPSGEQFADETLVNIIEEITENLHTHYGGSFSAGYIMEASIIMSTRAVSQKSFMLDFNSIEQVVGNKIKYLIIEIVDSVKETYHIDLNNDKFMVRFAIHIKNLLLRVKRNQSLSSSQFINIKTEYPFLHVIAVYISYIIMKREQCHLSEDDIAYIALHIGVMLEEQTVHQEKLTCVIIALDYNTDAKNIYKKITQTFSDSLFVQGVFTGYDQIEGSLDNIDLIISNYSISNTSLPNIVVKPFLSEADISEIFNKIKNLKSLKRKNSILAQIEEFIQEDLCFFNYDFKTSEDAIETICDYMLERNYVHQNFKKDIYVSERISPSSYGNIAIVHTLTNNDLFSHIALSINPSPIIWGDNKVNIVFLISLNKKDRELFRDIFRFLTDIVQNNQAFAHIMRAKSYEELKEIFRFFL